MTAAMFLRIMRAGKEAQALGRTVLRSSNQSSVDLLDDHFSRWLRDRQRWWTEAISLWSWNSAMRGRQRVSEPKRWLDSLSVGCGLV
jgi:hypothetical protein